MSPAPESESLRPPPRAAFRTTTSGTTRPAPARLTSFQAELAPAATTQADRPNEKTDKADKHVKKGHDEMVSLTVRMPRSVRKRLRSRAEEEGYTGEDAAYHLIRSWLQS